MIDDVDISNDDVVDLRDLRSFVTVARHGSFTAAAKELGYTQSAVSQHVAALELAVGRSLLLRRPVRLTPAGERLSEHAAHILLRLDVAHSELSLADDTPTSIRVTMTPLAPSSRVAAALREMRSASPTLAISVVVTDATEAARAVADGRADLAVVDGVVAPGNPLAIADAGLLASFWIVEDEVGVIVPADHPLRVAAVPLDAVVDALWIDAQSLTPGLSAIAGLALSERRPGITCSGVDVAALLALVAAGHGLALLPIRVCDTASGVRAIPVAAPSLVHRSELLVLKNAVDRHRPFIDALRR